jgi:hypothetical protein
MTTAFTKGNNLIYSYLCYHTLVTKVLHDICTGGQNGIRLSKTKWATTTLFSHCGSHTRLQATKILASLTYPLKKTKSRLPRSLDITET